MSGSSRCLEFYSEGEGFSLLVARVHSEGVGEGVWDFLSQSFVEVGMVFIYQLGSERSPCSVFVLGYLNLHSMYLVHDCQQTSNLLAPEDHQYI